MTFLGGENDEPTKTMGYTRHFQRNPKISGKLSNSSGDKNFGIPKSPLSKRKWSNDLDDLGYLHFRTPPSSMPFRHLLSSLGQGFAQARKPCRGRVVDVTLAERFGTRLLEVSGKNGGEFPQKTGN